MGVEAGGREEEGERGVRKPKRKCRICYPAVEALLYAVGRLRHIYPGGHIHVAMRGALEDAVSAARFAAAFTRGSCREKKLAAAAALFYEIYS